MKKIFLIMILLLTAVLVIDSIKYIKNYDKLMQTYDTMIQQGYELNKPEHMDVFTKQQEYYQNGNFVIIQFIYPLLLIILGTLEFHKKIHSGFFKDELIRQDFKKYLKKEYLSSCKAALLIPTIILITFAFSCIVTKLNFNLNSLDYSSISQPQIVERTLFSEILKTLFTIINLFIVSLACINIGLICTKRNKNFVISSIFAYLLIVIYQVLVEIIIGPILSNVFNNNFFANGLTLFSFWYYDNGTTPYNMFVYAILLFITTYFAFKKVYKNKEDVIIYAEK